MYPLLDLQFPAASIDEAVRLGLLAFCSSVFLQPRDLRAPYRHFTSAFRGCLATLRSSNILPPLRLWLLRIGAVSVVHDTADSLRKPVLLGAICAYEVDSWKKMKDLLESFMWKEMKV